MIALPEARGAVTALLLDALAGPVEPLPAAPEPGDDEERLHERIKREEHRLLPLAVRLVAEAQAGLAATTVTADRVVLALPFSILRSSVDYKSAGFKALKQTAIKELGMGTNSKLHVQFSDRHWEGLGCNGETFADTVRWLHDSGLVSDRAAGRRTHPEVVRQ